VAGSYGSMDGTVRSALPQWLQRDLKIGRHLFETLPTFDESKNFSCLSSLHLTMSSS
jgi:hypothetical protein